MNKAFGLDFGTTNSVLAIAQNNSVRVVDIDSLGLSTKTLQSVLFFDEEGGITVGQEAIDQYMSYGGTYGRFMQSIKAFLPSKSFTETYVYGKRYEIEDLIALILRRKGVRYLFNQKLVYWNYKQNIFRYGSYTTCCGTRYCLSCPQSCQWSR